MIAESRLTDLTMEVLFYMLLKHGVTFVDEGKQIKKVAARTGRTTDYKYFYREHFEFCLCSFSTSKIHRSNDACPKPIQKGLWLSDTGHDFHAEVPRINAWHLKLKNFLLCLWSQRFPTSWSGYTWYIHLALYVYVGLPTDLREQRLHLWNR